MSECKCKTPAHDRIDGERIDVGWAVKTAVSYICRACGKDVGHGWRFDRKEVEAA